MRVVRQRRAALVIPQSVMIITSVAGGSNPLVGQSSVEILGRGFGSSGVLRYADQVLTTSVWTDTRLVANWPDVPFNVIFAAVALDVDYSLVVRRSDGVSQTRLVRTTKAAADINKQITGIASGGIFANDSGVTVGMRFNWRTLSGTVTDIDATGQPRGTSIGATGRYAVWTGTSWTNTAQSIVQV